MIKRNNVFIHILILALISLAICDNGSASAASKNGNNISCINIQCNCTHTSVSEKCCCCTRNKTYEQYQKIPRAAFTCPPVVYIVQRKIHCIAAELLLPNVFSLPRFNK